MKLDVRWLEEEEVRPCTMCGHQATLEIPTKIWPGHRFFLCDDDAEHLLRRLAEEFGFTLEE